MVGLGDYTATATAALVAVLLIHNLRPMGKEVGKAGKALKIQLAAEAPVGLVSGRAVAEGEAMAQMLRREHALAPLAPQAAYSSWSFNHELRNHQLYWPCR